MSDRETMAAHFTAAAQLIREGGLAKETYSDHGAHCSVGALRVIQRGSVWDFDTLIMGSELEFLANLIGRPEKPEPCWCGEPHCTVGLSDFDLVTKWNDRPERTAEEVVELFERAAREVVALAGATS